VTFAGPVDHDRIPGYLARSHVFVSASRMEVQSLALIEALASGTPVVGLGNETVDQFVDETVGRRLPADAAPAEFARAVRAICELPQPDYAALCARGRARVLGLDWQCVVEETARAYQRLLDARPAARPGNGAVARGAWLMGAGIAAGSSAAYALMRRGRRGPLRRREYRCPRTCNALAWRLRRRAGRIEGV
jgi:hypothetical protein